MRYITDWSRLQEWINLYFPDPSYSTEDVRDFLENRIPAYSKSMSRREQRDIIGDWESFIGESVEEQVSDILDDVGKKQPSFWKRLFDRLKGRFG